MIDSAIPLVTARDVYVDDVTGDPVLRISPLSGDPTAYRLAPDACRVLGIALTAAADVAESGANGRQDVEASAPVGLDIAARLDAFRADLTKLQKLCAELRA